MIGKALLSGLWAHPQGCFTVRFRFAILTLARVSLFVSPFFSPLSLRVVVCFEVIKGESLCHSACAMWSRGSWLGGSLVSAWCCVASLTCVYGLVCVCFPLFLCLVSCLCLAILGCDDTMLPSPAWIRQWTGCQSFSCVRFWFCFCVLRFFVLFRVPLLFAWLMTMTTYWTMYRSFTNSLLWPSIEMALNTNLQLLLLQCHIAC